MVGRELVRALAASALLPFRALSYALSRSQHQERFRAALAAPAAPCAPPELPQIDRSLRVMVSCAEPSGELHAVNLVRAMRTALETSGSPPPVFVGLGGPRLEAEGVERIADPVSRAAMGATAGRQLNFYLGLLRDVAAELRERPADLVIPIDSPALHVPLGRIARSYGAAVVHFVTPQYWGWAPWRVRGYRSAVDLALTILPFEPAWFAAEGVEVAHVGHPILDELAEQPTDSAPPSSRRLALLPGSRAGVLECNLPWMLAAAARARLEIPELEVVVLPAGQDLAQQARDHIDRAGATGWVQVETGDLHGSLGQARAALSVSGTVLLDLLHHRLPTVVIYRLKSRVAAAFSRQVLTVPHFSSVNLLAGEEVLPEFTFHGQGPMEEVAAAVVRAVGDEPWRADAIESMDEARVRLGPPGAVTRAAGHALATALGVPRS